MKKRRLFLEKSDVLVQVGSVFVVIYDYAFVKKPKTFFGMGTVPHIKRMYKANSARMKACLEKLETDKKINQSYTNQIAGDTVAFATAQRR